MRARTYHTRNERCEKKKLQPNTNRFAVPALSKFELTCTSPILPTLDLRISYQEADVME